MKTVVLNCKSSWINS